jgi:hypothetical protein
MAEILDGVPDRFSNVDILPFPVACRDATILQRSRSSTTLGVSWLYLPAITYLILVVFGGLALNTYKGHYGELTVPGHVSRALLVFEYVLVILFFAANASPFIYFQF